MAATSTMFRIEDSSPLIEYDDGWTEGLPEDSSAFQYSGNQTFRLTTRFGSSMSFDFNGTSISINGAKRQNHGPYQVILDGAVSDFDGKADPPIFKTPLFAKSGLTQGFHNVKIVNRPTDTTGAPFLDVDFIEWRSDEQGTKAMTLENTDPNLVYTPASAWTVDMASNRGYSGGSAHVASSEKASMSFKFEGSVVQLIGSVGPDHGLYMATIDGARARSLNATYVTYQAQQMMYFADGLGPGEHVLKVTSTSGKLAVDCVTVLDYSGPKQKTTNVGAIAGIAVGGGIGLLLIVAGYLFWRRKHRRQGGVQVVDGGLPPVAQTQSMYNYNSPPATYHPGNAAPANNQYGGFGQSDSQYASQPGPYSVGSSASSDNPGDSSTSHTFHPHPQPAATSFGSQRDWRHPPREKDPNHLFLPARAQDGGPAGMNDPGRVPSSLPPDYFQATEADGGFQPRPPEKR